MAEFLIETAFLKDFFIAMNTYAFIVACVDKWHLGKYKKLFWGFTYCFGAIGSSLACILVHHKTQSGGVLNAIVLAVLQLIVYNLFSQWL